MLTIYELVTGLLNEPAILLPSCTDGTACTRSTSQDCQDTRLTRVKAVESLEGNLDDT